MAIVELVGITFSVVVTLVLAYFGYKEGQRYVKTGKLTQLSKGDKIALIGLLAFFMMVFLLAVLL